MVVDVEPSDGEPALAREGRRMCLLGSRSRPEHLRQLKAEVVAMGKSVDLPRLHLLALTCDMDPQTYAAEHSMLESLWDQGAISVAGQHPVAYCFPELAVGSLSICGGISVSARVHTVSRRNG
jgi:hypothetical protein